MNFQFFKEHPYGSAIGAVFLGLVFYFVSRKGGASTSASPNLSGAVDTATLQLQAAQQSQNAQLAAQSQAQQLQAGVATTQIAAQLQATQINAQTDVTNTANNNATAIAVAQMQTDAATTQQANSYTAAYNLQKLNADVLTTQLATGAATQQHQMDVVLQQQVNNNNTAIALQGQQENYNTNLAVLQTQTQLQTQQNYAALAASVAAKAGQKYNTKADADRATALLSQILAGGNPSPVIANTTAAAYTNIANSPANLIKSIGSVTAPIITGLFA